MWPTPDVTSEELDMIYGSGINPLDTIDNTIKKNFQI